MHRTLRHCSLLSFHLASDRLIAVSIGGCADACAVAPQRVSEAEAAAASAQQAVTDAVCEGVALRQRLVAAESYGWEAAAEARGGEAEVSALREELKKLQFTLRAHELERQPEAGEYRFFELPQLAHITEASV